MHVISKSSNSINGLKRNNLQEREDRTNPITIHLKKKKNHPKLNYQTPAQRHRRESGHQQEINPGQVSRKRRKHKSL